MKNKQTAVEWLESEMHELDYDRIFSSFEEYDTEREKLWEQAKQMQEEQIKNAYEEGEDNIDSDGCQIEKKDSEQYYNETYGK